MSRLEDLLHLERQVQAEISAERARLAQLARPVPLNARIRLWAAGNGFRVGVRGPLPLEIRRAYQEAQGQP